MGHSQDIQEESPQLLSVSTTFVVLVETVIEEAD